MKRHPFKRKRRINGVIEESHHYFGDVTLPGERPRVVKSLHTSDYQVAQQRLNVELRQRERKSVGLDDAREEVESLNQPLKEIIELFLRLKAKGCAPRTLTRYRLVIPRVCEAAGWTKLRDVTPESFEMWRASSALHAKTANDYLGAFNAMFNLMVKLKRMPANPLAEVGKQKVVRDVPLRRALSPKEFEKLLAVAPHTRGAVYLLAAYTGLRGGEMRQLRWGDVDLESKRPTLMVRASIAKGRRTDTFKLRPELVAALRRLKPAVVNAELPLFASVPRAHTMHRDLKRAKIPIYDEQGRRVDMHALRLTFGTYLHENNQPRVVMELMRHSDIKLTMGVYTDTKQLPLDRAIDSLPSFALPEEDPGTQRTQKSTQPADVRSLQRSQPVATGQTPPPAQVIDSVALRRKKAPSVTTGRLLEMERAKRLELSTSTLARWCSTN